MHVDTDFVIPVHLHQMRAPLALDFSSISSVVYRQAIYTHSGPDSIRKTVRMTFEKNARLPRGPVFVSGMRTSPP